MLKIRTIISSVIISLTISISAAAADTSVYSGSGEPGYKDGSSLESSFNQPYGLTFGIDGELIVVDSYNNRIRSIKNGITTTIAGSSSKKDLYGFPKAGYADGDVASAEFNKPRCAVVDSKGNIFVTDTGNHTIRKISNGKVSTFAGTGKAGYLDGQGHKAEFNTPSGIAIDSEENLYVADTLNNVIRKVTPKGEVSTFAGKYSPDGSYKDGPLTEAAFNEPSGIAFDKAGDLYILDSGNQLVRKVFKGSTTTIAGVADRQIPGTAYIQGRYTDGIISEAGFNFPKGICIADNGTIFIADTLNHTIRAVSPYGKVTTVAGTGSSVRKEDQPDKILLNSPADVVYKSGILYISDTWNNNIKALPVDTDSFARKPDRNDLIAGIEFDEPSGNIQIFVDKAKLSFNDVQPYENEGRTFVPLRFICEAWGADVKWFGDTGRIEISKGAFHRIFYLASDSIMEKDDRALIHIRYLAESMGFYVEWVPEYNAAVISTKDK